ncbi:MAG: pyrimidine 5'-nucleotidase [Anaerolineales bacterium]|nr:pyrimidine 5'-nucleotidase [Anaerolineales bacterium]
MRLQALFFDLDDTLYPRSSGIWTGVRSRIEQYMRERLSIPARGITALRDELLATYGTTLQGLMAIYQVDPDDYLLYVHDLPIEDMLRPNARLNKMLADLPQQKWIFTNASLEHARRVLGALGVSRYFNGIVDIKAMGFRNKPQPEAYLLALDSTGLPAAACLFADDQTRNLEPAKQLGMSTVLVGTREPHPAADHSVSVIEELLEVVPGLVE